MQEKHKVTLYLPHDLHRQLKIRAAVDAEPMSAIAERAIVFYLNHAEIVDEVETMYGRVHQVYSCPECTSSLVLRDGDMVAIDSQPSLLADEELSVNAVRGSSNSGEQELVPV